MFEEMLKDITLSQEAAFIESPIKALLIKLQLVYLAEHLNYNYSLSKENYNSLKGKLGLIDKNNKPIHTNLFLKNCLKNTESVKDFKCDIIRLNKTSSFPNIFLEVAHSDAIVDSLATFKKISNKFNVCTVIVAPDWEKNRFIKEANKPQFHDLNIRFFPYSAVEELYALCQKRKLKGITEEFLDCYMEHILMN